MDRTCFHGKRVLVTGHTGFKGAWLCLWLQRLGAEITGFGLPPGPGPSLFSSLRLADRVRHVEGDVRDLDALLGVVRESRPEVVFHLAAQSLVRRSYRDPKGTFDTNVGGTVNLLEALRLYGKARVLVNVTSDKCYAGHGQIWGHRETDPLGGDDPYSASKGCAELVFHAYSRSFFPAERAAEHGLALASARAGNVVGGGDWGEDRLVPDCVRALRAGRPVGIRQPASVRPWQHVLEPLGGYLLLAARLAEDPARWAGGWNFGPDAAGCRPVRDVADALVRYWGSPAGWVDLSAGQAAAPAECPALRLCNDKATSLLGWRPVSDFDRCIEMTTRWYRETATDPAAAERLCHDQIDDYQRRAHWLRQPVLRLAPQAPRQARGPGRFREAG